MAAAVMALELPTGSETNAIHVGLQPVGDAPLPLCEISGEIPTITWKGEGYHADVRLMLGNVDDAADYLRRMSRLFVALACEVEAGREKARERQPEGARS